MRSYPDIERAIDLCNKLGDNDPDERDMKKYLTEFLLVKTCAAYEVEIERIVFERAQKSGDGNLARFVSNTIESYRNLGLDSMRGNLVGKFGARHKAEFASRLDLRSKRAYESIVSDRNAVAHSMRSSMSFNEFIVNYSIAHKVLEELSVVLDLDESDLDGM